MKWDGRREAERCNLEVGSLAGGIPTERPHSDTSEHDLKQPLRSPVVTSGIARALGISRQSVYRIKVEVA